MCFVAVTDVCLDRSFLLGKKLHAGASELLKIFCNNLFSGKLFALLFIFFNFYFIL